MTDKYWDIGIMAVDGCTPVSAGCKNCWSAGMTHRFRDNLGLTDGPKFNGKIICNESAIERIAKLPECKTVSIWNDLFHEDVPSDFIDRLIFAADDRRDCVFFVLTKRPERLEADFEFDNENVFFGTTAENQEQADKRIPLLLKAGVESRFLSIEPMLGPVDLKHVKWQRLKTETWPVKTEEVWVTRKVLFDIDYVVVGCETGPNARPCKIEWIRDVVRQCKEAGVKCFVKAIPINGKPCRDISKFPEDLRVRDLI